MKISQGIDSLALFGSAVRGDSDKLSDRDLLVVGDESERESSRQAFAAQGYSPSFYNWSQFDGLVSEKSLFVQHLKQESSIVCDRDGRLTAALAGFCPGNNYDQRLLQNIELLNLTNGTPAIPASLAWGFDVLAVAFRNFAVLSLAQSGEYVFAFNDLVKRISCGAKLSAGSTALLSKLRVDKATYRSGQSQDIAEFRRLNETQCLLADLQDSVWAPLCISQDEFCAKSLAAEDQTHWYGRLRCYEGVYRALGQMPSTASTTLQLQIEWLIANPAPYDGPMVGEHRTLRELVFSCLEEKRIWK